MPGPRHDPRRRRGSLLPLLFLCLSAAWGENPRSHLISEPVSPRLSPSGAFFTAGPSLLFADRRSLYGGPNPRNLVLAGWSAGVTYDVSNPTGRWHLFPSAGAALFPGQLSYVDEYYRESFIADHWHLSAETFAGWSGRAGKPHRAFLSAGPTVNLLLWRIETYYSRLVFGWGLSGGGAFSLAERPGQRVKRLLYGAKLQTHARETLSPNEEVIHERAYQAALWLGVGW